MNVYTPETRVPALLARELRLLAGRCHMELRSLQRRLRATRCPWDRRLILNEIDAIETAKVEARAWAAELQQGA
jgi:hypothetical protein